MEIRLLKTRIGAIFAAAYLLIVFFVSTPFLFDVVVSGTNGGLHSTSGLSLLFTMMLTSPMSWPAVSAVDTNFAAATETIRGYLVAGGLAVSALVNAAVIYLFVWVVRRLVRALGR